MVKTYLAASADILFHSETSESNAERRFRDELLDQIYSTSIWQTQIADEHVKFLIRAELDGRLKSECRFHLITAPSKQTRKGTIGVLVIFHQQNAHRLALGEPGRERWGDLRLHLVAGGKS